MVETFFSLSCLVDENSCRIKYQVESENENHIKNRECGAWLSGYDIRLQFFYIMNDLHKIALFHAHEHMC